MLLAYCFMPLRGSPIFPSKRSHFFFHYVSTYKAAVIGSTGKGDYGHRLDTAFLDLEGVDLVAVADADPVGLAGAGDKLGVEQLFVDYRQMLEAVKPDFVSITPGWVTERVPMIAAAAAAGAHIYCEKPAAKSVAEMDEIVRACRHGKVKMAVAHQWRAMKPAQKASEEIQAGRYGKLLRMRARPKDDSRGGGEELLLHGTHLFDLMMALAGPPRWASGHVTVDGRDATREDATQGTQPVGPILGDSIAAMFSFDHGVRGYFDSTAGLAEPGSTTFANLYGLSVECERALLEFREPGDLFHYPVPRVLPDLSEFTWKKVWIEDWHGVPERDPNVFVKKWLAFGNQVLARDLIAAVEEDREPLSSISSVRFVNEMVEGVYRSHLSGGARVAIPLDDRSHPLK